VADAVSAGQVCRKEYLGKEISWLITNPEDEIQRHQISDGFYEVPDLEYIRSIGATYESILDIGSNIGNHAIYFSKILGAKKIYAVEPYGTACNHLIANVALNYNGAIDLSYLGYGIGSSNSWANVIEPTKWNLGLTQLSESDEGAIPLITGDDLLCGRPIDLVKIDVEGMEIEVLNGLGKTISKWSPDIFVEVANNNNLKAKEIFRCLEYVEIFNRSAYEDSMNFVFRSIHYNQRLNSS
jgi:FkbM family methyltransferase